ncbi:MAG: Dabb family protein [Bacteroidota bacterium]
MMKRIIAITLMSCMTLSIGLMAQAPAEVLNDYTAALASRSPSKIASTFHSQARILPDDVSPVEGSAAIEAYYQWVKEEKFQAALQIKEVMTLGEAIYIETSEKMVERSKRKVGTETAVYKGQMILKKENGEWKIFRYIFNETEDEEEEKAEAIEGDFVHMVFFWLKEPENGSVKQAFAKAIGDFLEVNEQVVSYHIGSPANTPREIVDNSYTFCLIVTFEDREGHDAYQVSDSHQELLKLTRPFWEKVQIYDSMQ